MDHPTDAAWLDALPRAGHFTYHLVAPAPGYTPEERVAHVYVGVTSNLRARLRAHTRKWWWSAIDPALCALEEHESRAAAEAAERQMIHDLQPAMNRAGRLLVVR